VEVSGVCIKAVQQLGAKYRSKQNRFAVKITRVNAIFPDYPNRPLAAWREHFWQIIVRIDTDAGICGYGYGGGGVAAREIVNRHFSELLVGREFSELQDILDIWDYLYKESTPYGRKGLAIMALSGLDLALWDLLGKAKRKPVHELLGGARKEKVRLYATGPDTEWYMDLGITAQKTSLRTRPGDDGHNANIDAVEDIRSALGPDGIVMIDNYMSWNYDECVTVGKQLEPFNIYFFEDVLTPDSLDELSLLRDEVAPVLLAGGEHEFTHHGFREVSRTNALDIWQPDLTWCGGITALLRILDLARDAGAKVVPHRGGEVWGLHAIAATDCEDFAELVMGPRSKPRDETREMWIGSPTPEDGALSLPTEPGFGVRLNEDFL
jgi:L-rhamnonate dehydratase